MTSSVAITTLTIIGHVRYNFLYSWKIPKVQTIIANDIMMLIFSVFFNEKKRVYICILADDQRIWLANKEGPLFWQSELKKVNWKKPNWGPALEHILRYTFHVQYSVAKKERKDCEHWWNWHLYIRDKDKLNLIQDFHLEFWHEPVRELMWWHQQKIPEEILIFDK